MGRRGDLIGHNFFSGTLDKKSKKNTVTEFFILFNERFFNEIEINVFELQQFACFYKFSYPNKKTTKILKILTRINMQNIQELTFLPPDAHNSCAY